jgi:hypothetical protein
MILSSSYFSQMSSIFLKHFFFFFRIHVLRHLAILNTLKRKTFDKLAEFAFRNIKKLFQF